MRAPHILSLLLAGALAACQCDDSGLVTSHGSIVTEAEIDLGEVGVGGRASRELTIGNIGIGPLRVSAIDRQEGFPPEFGITPDALSVVPSGEGKVTFFFDPVSEGPRLGKVVIRSDTPDKPSVEVTVKGVGVSTEIAATPLALDFGKVVKGSYKRLTFEVVNTGLKATTASILPIGGDAPKVYGIDPPIADLPLEGGQRAPVGVKFTPNAICENVGSTRCEFRAVVIVRACVNCPDVPISLRGEGIGGSLVAQPNPLLFPWVAVGDFHDLVLEVENLSTLSTTVSMAVVPQGGYRADFDLTFVSGPFPLGDKAKIPIDVRFEPLATGEHKGYIAIDSPGSARVIIEVTGYSGGPEIDARPQAVSFGPVQVGMSVNKTVSLFNLAPDDPTTLDNLIISAIATSNPEYEVRLPPAAGTLPLTVLPGRSLLLTLTYRPAAEGADPASLTIASNDQDEPATVVPLSGAGVANAPCVYTVVPDPDPGLVFGILPPATTVKQNLTLRNIGSNACILSRLSFVGANGASHDPAFSIIGFPSGVTNFTLALGATKKYEVGFTAGQDRDHADVIRVEMAASAMPQVDVKLSGTSKSGCLNVAPRTKDFGGVQPGCSSNSFRFTATNNCSVGARLDQFLLSSPLFQLVSGPPVGFLLAPGAQSSYTVKYVPTPCPAIGPCTTTGLDFGYATLHNSVGPPVGIALTGEATQSATYTDSFTQVSTPQVDVLWVVDNSGSMGEEQGSIANNMSSFVQYLTGLDYHLAATTTDVIRGGGGFSGDSSGEDGRFVGSPQIITNTTPNAAVVFGQNVGVGTNGDYIEMGLEAAYRAIFTRENEHPSFLRTNAYLSVIVLSDEEDAVHASRTVEWYHQQFIAKKGGDRTKFLFSAITGGPSGCSTASSESRYTRMVQLTGGVWETICTPNWSQALQNIGQISTGFLSRFVLSRQAEPGTVSVTVNNSSSATWTYDPATNAVIFNQGSPPPAGATVVVTYKEHC